MVKERVSSFRGVAIRPARLTGAVSDAISPACRACHGFVKAAVRFKSPGLETKGGLLSTGLTVVG